MLRIIWNDIRIVLKSIQNRIAYHQRTGRSEWE